MFQLKKPWSEFDTNSLLYKYVFRFKCIFKIRYSKSVGATHFQTSAKANRGIEELFLEITQQLLKAADREIQTNNIQSPNRNTGVVIVDDAPLPKKNCCGF